MFTLIEDNNEICIRRCNTDQISKLNRLLAIWEERTVYPRDIIAQMRHGIGPLSIHLFIH